MTSATAIPRNPSSGARWSAGFARVELFGGYDGRPFGLDTPAVIRASI